MSMRVSGLNMHQPIFKAHSYEVEHKNTRVAIQTDNEKNLGNEPYLVSQHSWGKDEEKMRKEGDLYSATVYTVSPDFRYHILYKDTGNIDLKDGEDYRINPRKMLQRVAHDSRIMHRQPTIFTIKEGKTVGKIVYDNDGYGVFSEKSLNVDEPTIIITPAFEHDAGNPNIVGIIFTAYDCGAFSHITTQLRQQTNVCGAVFEPNVIEKLISLNGKNVELEIKDGAINFKETNEIGRPMVYPKIDVPKLKPCNKVLTSKEYISDIIGAKAVNLRRLEELKEQGKIDAVIPESIALSHGYIQEILEEISQEKMDNLCKMLFDNGIVKDKKDQVMVRSAFNGEDLPNYSAAGIYRTTVGDTDDIEHFYRAIRSVAKSKWDDNAIFSREMYNIPEDNIQFGVLLQRRIRPDYKFTLYTDDEKDNLKIDLSTRYFFDKTVNPNTFTYNKKTGELTYDSIQLENPVGIFNENQELESIEPVTNDLSDNKELFEQIRKVAENALVVEKEFGHPQDIEGGIKGDEIYFWQSRNIVR